MKPTQRLACLERQPRLDLVVVGGGATGLGVALDAALRGFTVALFESHDFAGGTSSRSTKLLHGGVRYLAQGNIALVREALTERSTVLRIAPHLAQPLPFVMPAYAWWEKAWYGAGLKLYDWMAGRARLGPTRLLDPAQTLAALPGIRPEGLQGGVEYWDAQFDDARLALALARTAVEAGAQLFNYAEVEALQRLAAGGWSVTVRDRCSGHSQSVEASCVVNATGVWVDALRARAGVTREPERMVSPSQGVHVVVDRTVLPGDHALLVPKTRDGRVLFAVPWLGKLVLGTTDTPRPDSPREPQPFAEELAFLLSEAAHVLRRPVLGRDIRSVWVGLRPLVAPPRNARGETKALSREHTVVVEDGGLLTVTGGKWTTYRAMAEDVMAHCFAAGLLPPRPGAQTARHRLDGAPVDGEPPSPPVPIHAPPGLHLYGRRAPEVLACPGAQNLLGLGLTEAMVRYAVRHEYAHTVEDVLARRWRALFLDARAAAAMAPRVAEILTEEGCAEPRLGEFEALCRHYLPTDA